MAAYFRIYRGLKVNFVTQVEYSLEPETNKVAATNSSAGVTVDGIDFTLQC